MGFNKTRAAVKATYAAEITTWLFQRKQVAIRCLGATMEFPEIGKLQKLPEIVNDSEACNTRVW